ncbi:MAG: YceD family protein [Alphaproteobacteria bacterium]
MTSQIQTPKPEFSRVIAIEGIAPDKKRKEAISATEEECAALAARFGIRGLRDFVADLSIRRVPGGTVRIEGTFSADVVQACVVSLQDVHAHIDGQFDTYFTEDAEQAREEIAFTLDDDLDAAEMVHNGMIDMGEVVAQYLALELDPYPRAPGVNLAAQLHENGTAKKANPFQVLEALKGEKSQKGE